MVKTNNAWIEVHLNLVYWSLKERFLSRVKNTPISWLYPVRILQKTDICLSLFFFKFFDQKKLVFFAFFMTVFYICIFYFFKKIVSFEIVKTNSVWREVYSNLGWKVWSLKERFLSRVKNTPVRKIHRQKMAENGQIMFVSFFLHYFLTWKRSLIFAVAKSAFFKILNFLKFVSRVNCNSPKV